MEEILIVDGYNMIGAWPKLQERKNLSLEDARDELLTQLANFQAFSGMRVIVVFDAHRVPGTGKTFQKNRIEVCFTKENETADERIERLVAEMKSKERQIYVATSDYAEQRMIFGQGALRKSARELLAEVENAAAEISRKVKETNVRSPKRRIPFTDEIAVIFEKWRRQK
ncbi:ribosome-dependent mRNA decay endonuclease Rae1/YacP [Bacillaceae bacterium]